MAYCRKCGAEMPDTAKFCKKCCTEVEKKTSWGWGIAGLILVVIGLTMMFGLGGTIAGLAIAAVVLLLCATQK